MGVTKAKPREGIDNGQLTIDNRTELRMVSSLEGGLRRVTSAMEEVAQKIIIDRLFFASSVHSQLCSEHSVGEKCIERSECSIENSIFEY